MASCCDKACKKDDCCSVCNTQTNYKCIQCSGTVCNRCTVFEENEEVDGWQEMKSVGYSINCNELDKAHKFQADNIDKKRALSSSSETRFVEKFSLIFIKLCICKLCCEYVRSNFMTIDKLFISTSCTVVPSIYIPLCLQAC